MRRLAAAAILSAVCGGAGLAQNNQQVPKALEPFVKIDAPGVLIDHVRVIDGTGAPAKEDQVILIVNGKISMIGSAGQPRDQLMPAHTKTIDGSGKTVFPLPSIVLVFAGISWSRGCPAEPIMLILPFTIRMT